MPLWERRPKAGKPRGSTRTDLDHLVDWARARSGVEAYVEPRTVVTEWTVMLIAGTGEWTRRRVPGQREAHELAKKLGVPIYDVAATGYPQRKRDWDARRATEGG
jgi:hypothetical protein